MNLLKGSIFLKISALAVAVLVYFYIHNEISTNEQKFSDPSYKLIKLTAKNLPVKVRFETSPPEGYAILEDSVTVEPNQVVVIGPEALLDDAKTAETGIVDISDSTKTVTKNIPLESVSGIHLAGEPFLIEVTVPIKKIEEPPVVAEPLATAPATDQGRVS